MWSRGTVHIPSRASSGDRRGAAAMAQSGEERSPPFPSGAAGNSPWCVWACLWPQVSREGRPAQPHLHPPALGPLFPVARPPVPSPRLPISWAPHSRRDCLAALRWGVQLLRTLRDGLGGVCSPSGCRLQDQESLRGSGFDGGLACAWRHKACVLGPPWLSALGWPHAGLSHSPRVSPRWGEGAPGPLSLLAQTSCCCLPFPELVLFPGSSRQDLLASQGPLSLHRTPRACSVWPGATCIPVRILWSCAQDPGAGPALELPAACRGLLGTEHRSSSS